MSDLERARWLLRGLQGEIPDEEWATRYAAHLQLELDAQERRYRALYGDRLFRYLADSEAPWPLAMRQGAA